MRRLCVIPGDGIGQEVVPVAVRVLQRLLPDLEIVPAGAGWGTFERQGVAVPPATLAAVRDCGAALFGAVSSPAGAVEGYRSAILTLRQTLNLHTNLRPVRSLPIVSPRPGVNLLVVRENTEGLYAGRERREGDGAVAERVVTRAASRRLAVRALALAASGSRRRMTIVHKANVLPLTDGLFRDTVRAAAAAARRGGQQIEVDEMLVDLAALQMVARPEQFDMIVTTNLYGDILSDAAAHWAGGLGLAPSLNLGDAIAIAEPVHGSAPDIAGSGRANPIAAVLSAALLLRHHWGLGSAAARVEQAVSDVLTASGGTDLGPDTLATIERELLYRLHPAGSPV